MGQQVVQQSAWANKVAVVEVPLGPAASDCPEVLGQGQDGNGKEEWATRIPLVHSFRAGDHKATVRKKVTR
jgi:hypothetical protein